MKKNKNSKNTGLGSGLSSLLGNEFEKKAIFSDSSVNDKFKMVPVEFIEPGPWQPRKTFDKSEIESLAKSIKKQGVIQPIILKSKENKKNEFFIIIPYKLAISITLYMMLFYHTSVFLFCRF